MTSPAPKPRASPAPGLPGRASHDQQVEALTGSRARRRRGWLPAVNMPLWERVARMVTGSLLAATVLAGGGLLAALGDPLRQVVAVVLALSAVDLLVSGAVGFCPLYRYVRMPWTPGRPR